MVMRIKYFFIWSRLPAYAQSCLESLAENSPTYFCSQGETPTHNYLNQGIDIFGSRWLDFIRLAYKIVRLKPEYLFLPGWQYKRFLILAVLLSPFSVQIVFMADTIQLNRTNSKLVSIGVWYLNSFANSIFVPGKLGHQFFRSLGYRGQLVKGLYSADTNLYKRDSYLAMNGPVNVKRLLFIGRVEPVKGIIEFIDWMLDNPNIKDVELTIIGDGSLISSVRQSSRIHTMGWLSAPDILEQMRVSDMLVLPSKYEPWGVVVHEALCAGLEVLCSNKVGSSIDFDNSLMVHTYTDFDEIEEILSSRSRVVKRELNWDINAWVKNINNSYK